MTNFRSNTIENEEILLRKFQARASGIVTEVIRETEERISSLNLALESMGESERKASSLQMDLAAEKRKLLALEIDLSLAQLFVRAEKLKQRGFLPRRCQRHVGQILKRTRRGLRDASDHYRDESPRFLEIISTIEQDEKHLRKELRLDNLGRLLWVQLRFYRREIAHISGGLWILLGVSTFAGAIYFWFVTP